MRPLSQDLQLRVRQPGGGLGQTNRLSRMVTRWADEFWPQENAEIAKEGKRVERRERRSPDQGRSGCPHPQQAAFSQRSPIFGRGRRSTLLRVRFLPTRGSRIEPLNLRYSSGREAPGRFASALVSGASLPPHPTL